MGTHEDAGRPTASSAITQTRSSAVVAGSAFVMGLATGVFLPQLFKQLRDRAVQRRVPQQTVVYRENLPESMARREPTPAENQPRYGGTGSLGVSPRAVNPTLGDVESSDPSPQ